MTVRIENPTPTRVTGDWLGEDFAGYPALLAGRWNGWAVPLVTREVADEIVAAQAKLHADDADAFATGGLARLEWDGDTLVKTESGAMFGEDEDDYVERIEPTASGLYDIGFGWCWYTVDDFGDEPSTYDDPTAPTEAQVAAFKSARESLDMFSGSRSVRPDGAHAFPVSVVTRREGMRSYSETVGVVVIARDGTITVEPLKASTPESANEEVTR